MKIDSLEETLYENIPNSRKFRIKFESVNKRKEFFDALDKIKKVTYDWGHDALACNGISISGEDFIEIADVCALTSADIIYVLRWNDIDVTIVVEYGSEHATFKNEQELKEFLEEINQLVKMEKIS